MNAALDLDEQVIRFIERSRKEDGGVYWTRVIGGFTAVEGADIEAALARLHDAGRVCFVGREKTSRRVFLTDVVSARPSRLDHEGMNRLLASLDDDGYDVTATT
ncbi:hypothetical protein [Streptomyces sp. NPDC047981]|uniref:hypothetical protein n=1 Tax=Streptomyces sp. NPDC047981 TaxID=3154610 RepID=UPI00343B066B